MNFVENSNKLQKIGFRRENELSVFTLGANNTCYIIYLWREVVCFALSQWYFPTHDILGYVMELIIKKFSMNRGAPTWFWMLIWSYSVESIDYWTIFSLNSLKNQDWKLYWNLGALLVLLESPHQVWFNIVDFVILRLKCEQYYWIFGGYYCWKFKQIAKKGWKENSIEWIQTWANDIGYVCV